MACNVPTAFPSDCAQELLGLFRAGKYRSGRTVSISLYVGSYFASFLPEQPQDDESGVLKLEEPLSVEGAIAFLEVAQSQHESGAAAAFDYATILKFLAFLQQLSDLYRGLKGS